MECLSFRTLIVVKSRLRFAIGIPFFIHSVQPPCCTQYSYSSRNINTRYLSFHPHSSLNSLTHSLAQSQQPRCTHSHLCSFVEHAHIYYATSTAGGNNSRLEDYMRLLCELFFYNLQDVSLQLFQLLISIDWTHKDYLEAYTMLLLHTSDATVCIYLHYYQYQSGAWMCHNKPSHSATIITYYNPPPFATPP